MDEGVAVRVAVVADRRLARSLIARWAADGDCTTTVWGKGSPLARAALRALLAQHTGRADWRVVRDPLGKPFVVTPSGEPGPAVSLSHTDGVVAVALAESGSIGIDVERHRQRDFSALAAQAFGPLEQARVAVGGEAAFYRIWTLREAMAKATSEGLARVLAGDDLTEDVTSHSSATLRLGRFWHLVHLRPERGCSLSVAHAGAAERPWMPHWSDIGDMATP